MSTQLALELLTQTEYDLATFIAGLGLLGNETTIAQLYLDLDLALIEFQEEYKTLKTEVDINASRLEVFEEKLTLAADLYAVENDRLQDFFNQKAKLVREIESFQEQKVIIEQFQESGQKAIEDKINEIKQDFERVEGELDELKQNEPNSELIDGLEKELFAYVHQLESHKDLLSLNGLDNAQKLDTIELQIQQKSENLEVLETTKIPQQQDIVDGRLTKYLETQTALESLQTEQATATEALDLFEEANAFLLTADWTNFSDGQVGDNSSEVVILQQQVLALEKLQIIEERLTSLQSQESSEEGVDLALAADTIASYVQLNGQLATEVNDLSAIWLGNLQESHDLTGKLWDLSHNRAEKVDDFVAYVEENLATPEGIYVLDRIQLEEAILRQEAQVKYRDTLAQSVDSLQEAIEVFEARVEQVEILSEKLEHISTLTTYERSYVGLQEAVNRLDSSQENDYQWANNNVVDIVDYLLEKLGESDEYNDIVEQLQTALNNYQDFLASNQANYSNLYQNYLDIQNNLTTDLNNIQDDRNAKLDSISEYDTIRSDVTGNYYFLTAPNTWKGAQAKAESAGGYLVAINTAQEQQWLIDWLPNTNYFIGLTDREREGSFKWVNGDPLTFRNFAYREPNNSRHNPEGQEDYVHMYGSGQWNDVSNYGLHDNPMPGIIEVNFHHFDQQEKAARDKAKIDSDKVFADIQNLNNQGIKVLIDETQKVLNPLLIERLNDEITNKTQGLDVEIDLENDQQEQWIEENLQTHIQKTSTDILQNQEVKLNNVLFLDGINDSVQVAHNSSLDLVNEWTLEAWIWRDKTGRIDPIIEKYNWQHGFGGFNIRVTDQNKLIANVINGLTANTITSSQNIGANKWYHVAATFEQEEKTLKLYINGDLEAVNNNVTILPISSNVSLKIGERGDSLQPRYWYFDGKIDEARVWNVALDQKEIQNNLNQRLTGEESGLVGYWNFEGEGNKVFDLSKNHNHGTLNEAERTTDINLTLFSQYLEEKAISDLQNLRIETAYLTLQAEQNPDKLQNYLETISINSRTVIYLFYPLNHLTWSVNHQV